MYNSFGPPDALPGAASRYPAIFGEQFYKIVYLNSEIMSLPNNYKTFFAYLFNEDMDGKLKIKCEKIAAKMKKLVYTPKEDKISIKKVQDTLSRLWDKNEESVKKEIKQIFGFDLPNKIYIVINEGLYENGSGGSALYSSNNLAISLDISRNHDSDKYVLNLITVVIHEMLHTLISKHNVINRKKDKEYFEESILDYFVPYGILAEKLGIIEKKSIIYYHECNVKNRKYSENISKKLLPVIEEYYKSKVTENIWAFLKKRGFKQYFEF
jgi:hypothetical protein